MNFLFICVVNFLIINCYAFNIKDIGNRISQLTSELGITETQSTDQSKLVSDICSHKCSKELAELKQNMTELYMAFLALHAEMAHLNKHMMFHEKALKHIAVWGHKHNDHNFHNENPEVNSQNQSSLNEEQNEDPMRNSMSSKGMAHNHRQHRGHHRDGTHEHHYNRHHCHHSHNPLYTKRPPIEENESDDKKKDSSEEDRSSEEQTKAWESKIVPNFDSKINQNLTLNDSQSSPTAKSHKRSHSSKQPLDEQMQFQSLGIEFKEWFDNMVNGIHSKHNIHSDREIDFPDNRSKAQKHSFETKVDQKIIDEMETALGSEELVFATCHMKPNRHIALLNQQDIEGTINLWQLKENRGPLHMHIKLKGFKVSNHEHQHSQHQSHSQANSGSSRFRRESILMPVEREPDESTTPIGASHNHGFHVHESANLSRDCQSVGNHYNPLNSAHGGPYDVIRHVGDLGNIRCDRNGQIDKEYTFSQISLSGVHSIINRSLVIHSNADDYGRNPNSPSSSSTGSSGVRIACCAIEEVKALPEESDTQSSVGSVAAPLISSKRRRDTSEKARHNRQDRHNDNQNGFEESNLSNILKKFAKYENELKYKTLMDLNESPIHRKSIRWNH